MPAIYRRVKDQAGKWKYERVGAGRRLPDAPDSPFHRKRSTNAPVQGEVFMLKCEDECRTAVSDTKATDKRGS